LQEIIFLGKLGVVLKRTRTFQILIRIGGLLNGGIDSPGRLLTANRRRNDT
jgi:hypothetical protein